jgi:carbon storage regulator
MLTLTRKPGERIVIGNDVDITIVDVARGKVRVGIRAPRGMPIHRGEVRDRIEQSNIAAATALSPEPMPQENVRPIEIPSGLYGLRAHTRFGLFDVEGYPFLRQLVSLDDELVRLLVIDAEMVLPDYPVDLARDAANIEPGVEIALAAVVTLPRDGRPPTVALASPIVIDVEKGWGMQVILEHPKLPMCAEVSFEDKPATPSEEKAAE